MMLGCGGVPRGRGEGGNLLRAHRFKLRNPRTALYFSRPVYSARKRLGGFYKKSAYCNDGLTCGNRQMHKAEGVADALLLRFSSATLGATAADCACIASCAAFTKATLRAR